jgi:signal transduction histidine kinase
MNQELKVDDRPPFWTGRRPLSDFSPELKQMCVFASMSEADLSSLGECDVIEVPADGTIFSPEQPIRGYCILLEGEVVAEREEQDGSLTRIAIGRMGDCFGEVILLSGRRKPVRVFAAVASRILCMNEEQFWQMMSDFPMARRKVLDDYAKRQYAYQAEALHREKLISLGTLAAGLMHELHNPGSAARRASSQLRENISRLQELSLRFCDQPVTEGQLTCMRDLQHEAIVHARCTTMSSMEQMDAEDAMTDWLERAGVQNASRIAPQLVSMGMTTDELECTRRAFNEDRLSDALNWLESLVSSIALVDVVEQSVARMSELVMAVKKFAYDDRCSLRRVDAHENIQSTLTILGHKLRQRRIAVLKHFDATDPGIQTGGVALSQVWTNLLDNAIDASSDGGVIEVRTWNEPDAFCVGIADHGTGIPEDVREHIFEPFFTTKPVGKGTGLGLEIAHRIVTQNFRGTLEFESRPGHTEFLVRLPRASG